MAKHPWSAIPAARSSAPKLRTKLILIVSLLLLAIVSGPISLILSASNAKKTPIATIQTNSAASGLASIVAANYLSNTPTQVPVADGVDPTWGQGNDPSKKVALPYSTLSHVNATDYSSGATQYQIDEFTYITLAPKSTDATNKSTSQASPTVLSGISITMFITPDGPILATLPSLHPIDTTSNKYNALDYSNIAGYQQGAPNQTVSARIGEWASAYATNDEANLLVYTGDPQTSVYQGLGNFTLDSAPIVEGYLTNGSMKGLYHGQSIKDTDYVRIKVVFKSSSAQLYKVSNEFDLLVSDVTSSQPHIVAWGPAGSAPLVPYSNSNRH